MAQIEGIKEASKQKEQLTKDEQERSEKARAEEIAYYQKIADMEVEIASTKNSQLKQLLQEDLDEYIRVHEEKAALVMSNTAYYQYDKMIEELEKKINEAKTDAEKTCLKKQLEELQSFREEFFKNVTLAEEQSQALLSQKQQEINLKKERDLLKQHYSEMNETENLQAEARLLIAQENEEDVIVLLSEYSKEWKQKGKEHAGSYTEGIGEGLKGLTESVEKTTQALDTLKEKGVSEALKKDLSEAEKYIPKYRTFGESLADAFKTGFGVIQAVPAMLAEMIVNAAETIESGMNTVIAVIRGKNDETIEVFEEYKPKWKEAFVSLIDSALEGMDFNRLLDKAREEMAKLKEIITGGEEIDVDAFGLTDAEREQERRLKIYLSESGILKPRLESPLNANVDSDGTIGNGGVTIQKQEININQPVESPAEMTRAINNANKDLALMTGL